MRTARSKSLLAITLLILFFFVTANAQTSSAEIESFDTTTPPQLPFYWTQDQTINTAITWVTTSTSPNSPPHAAFANEPPEISSAALVTPLFMTSGRAATLRFRINYNLEVGTSTGFDGMVLEIRRNLASNWEDIFAAGGSFVSGGYTHTISTNYGNPIGGRRAWSGDSAGYITCVVKLPPAGPNGMLVYLRWRLATDSAIGGSGVRIDDIRVANGNLYMPFDFDGDAKTDIGIFRPATSEWWINRSSNGQTFATQFGASSDVLAASDLTGDGLTDITFWRPSTGFWYVLRSEDFSFYSFPFGTNGDIPAPADYDGDSRADPAVFRPSIATWFISKSTGGTTITPFGAPQDKPVPADYDGDGRADIAIYRPSVGEWWLLRSNEGPAAVQFGTSTDRALPADFTGDGLADIAFWRPSTGDWFVLRSEDFSFYSFPFGAVGDFPVQGDYDGDGKMDAGVFRPSVATWFVKRSYQGIMIAGFGASGDTPVPSEFVR